MRLEANSEIFRNLCCVPEVRGADMKHIAALSHHRSQKHSSSHIGFGRKKGF
jgi:hypothetical protein